MEDQPQHNPTEPVQDPEQEWRSQKQRRWLSGWRLALVITSVLVAGVMTLVVIFSLTLFKNPSFQDALEHYRVMIECEENLEEIGAALIRYYNNTDVFPEKLEELVPDYLASTDIFHCPADTRAGAVSYSYNRPREGDPGDAVVSICPRHRTLENQPKLIVELHKDGSVTHAPLINRRSSSRSKPE